jgi:fumarylacetoacetate (FAA) hydrolase
MKLATFDNGTPDGLLHVVSADNTRALPAPERWRNLLTAMERWSEAAADLQAVYSKVEGGEGASLELAGLRAPMPRSWQWLDGSAFTTHSQLVQVAFGIDPVDTSRPLMYQGLSDRFYSPAETVPFTDEDLGIDFEGEFGVIVDQVPMGVTPEQAASHIRLIVLINDWSLRTIAPIEMKTGFGWVQAKPPCTLAPFAVTPDELGDAWRDGRVCLNLEVHWNDRLFGRVNGDEMAFSFPELIAHAARTRELVAGTIIGSGTVANADYASRGSACISERRAIEMIATGAAETNFMRFGDRVLLEAFAPDGRSPFGAIEQAICKAG